MNTAAPHQASPPMASLRVRLVVVAKAPVAGQAKTRLVPALGLAGAARLAEGLLADAFERVTALQALARQAAMAAKVGSGPVPVLTVELCATPRPTDPAWAPFLPAGVDWDLSYQGQGDLGDRMGRASLRAIANGCAVLLVGTDCPLLSPGLMWQAVCQLAHHDAVLIPAADGGYVLLGLRQHANSVFTDMPWSTNAVACQTLARLHKQGCTVWQGPTLPDVDEPADLVHLPALLTAHLSTQLPVRQLDC